MTDEQKVPSMEVTLYRINLSLMNIKDVLNDIRDALDKK